MERAFETDTAALFDMADATDPGKVRLAIYNTPGRIDETKAEYFENSWRVCLHKQPRQARSFELDVPHLPRNLVGGRGQLPPSLAEAGGHRIKRTRRSRDVRGPEPRARECP